MALNFANNNSLSAITTKPSGLSGGTMNLISTQTASNSSTISFTSGIDDSYDKYVFKFYDIHPSASGTYLYFNGTDDDSSHSFDVTQTTTFFRAYNFENDAARTLEYVASMDVAQSTNARLASGLHNDNDSSLSGYLHLFNPSSTTFVKNFMSDTNYEQGAVSINSRCAGYFNTTEDITGVEFKMSSGNIDSGVIKLYGIS